MADNAERIAALEEEIEGYKQDLKNAVAAEDKRSLRELMVETRKTLNLLLQAQPGKSLYSAILHKLSI